MTASAACASGKASAEPICGAVAAPPPQAGRSGNSGNRPSPMDKLRRVGLDGFS
jgi:hypothetical protein